MNALCECCGQVELGGVSPDLEITFTLVLMGKVS